ncbi:MAG: hypothetical protein AAFX78_02025 [Cyanobacteria bacterium J06638_20]
MVLTFPEKGRFVDRWGITRPVYGCSLLGRDAFWEGIAELAGRLAETEAPDTFQQRYDWDRQIKYLVEHLLKLNGIDPDWVTLDQAEQLLIRSTNGAEGWLLSVNRPKGSPAKGKKAQEPVSTTEIIASLSLHTGSVDSAIRLADEAPADFIVSILEARAELTAPPKERRRRQVRKHKAELLEDLDRIHAAQAQRQPVAGGVGDD